MSQDVRHEPQSPLGQAITYLKGQCGALGVFPVDGQRSTMARWSAPPGDRMGRGRPKMDGYSRPATQLSGSPGEDPAARRSAVENLGSLSMSTVCTRAFVTQVR